jgi:hypothetical protein
MKRNIGTIDKVIRLLLVLFVVIGYFAHMIVGWAALGLGALAAVLTITSIAGLCPLYLPLKISTKGK